MSARGEHNIGELCRKDSVQVAMQSALVPITAQLQRHLIGTRPWR